MASLLKSTYNTRYLREDKKRYIRSDRLTSLTQDEINWLKENNYLTLVDLRSSMEIEKEPCVLKDNEHFNYLHMPVNIGKGLPKSENEMGEFYINMVDNRMLEIIETIENAKSNVVYFCAVVKDRTGVVSALLLLKDGMERKYIVDNYALSYNNIRVMLEGMVNELNLGMHLAMSKPEYMEHFLDVYNERFVN